MTHSWLRTSSQSRQCPGKVLRVKRAGVTAASGPRKCRDRTPHVTASGPKRSELPARRNGHSNEARADFPRTGLLARNHILGLDVMRPNCLARLLDGS